MAGDVLQVILEMDKHHFVQGGIVGRWCMVCLFRLDAHVGFYNEVVDDVLLTPLVHEGSAGKDHIVDVVKPDGVLGVVLSDESKDWPLRQLCGWVEAAGR